MVITTKNILIMVTTIMVMYVYIKNNLIMMITTKNILIRSSPSWASTCISLEQSPWSPQEHHGHHHQEHPDHGHHHHGHVRLYKEQPHHDHHRQEHPHHSHPHYMDMMYMYMMTKDIIMDIIIFKIIPIATEK
ncbi:hypothetical protein CEXT_272421 [Caerostris extrusa]|uniref:Histidine-rich glycoprotein-like n=1 Tax=Caerostris extrusa TaxID=172846 RepID=A0AAV4SZF4_CAEEX|nr:hypothetical protein CEXT_272421 [Caerostris extrusa]